MNALSCFLLLVCFTFHLSAQTGKVIAIKDGDTIVILDDDNIEHSVRVADIDCPEMGQPFGKKAKWFTSGELFQDCVTVVPKHPLNPLDNYGRILGYVKYGDKDLSEELLRAGLAWHYKYYSDSEHLARLEAEAKEKRIGLWADPKPIRPYEWRKGNR